MDSTVEPDKGCGNSEIKQWRDREKKYMKRQLVPNFKFIKHNGSTMEKLSRCLKTNNQKGWNLISG